MEFNMKIYRGPSSKDLSDDSHEQVDEQDLSNSKEKWVGSKKFKVNITKNILARQSVAHVELMDKDILSLHQGLISGIYDKALQVDWLTIKVKYYESALEKILTKIKLNTFKVKPDETIQLIKDIAEECLKRK